MPYIYAMVQLDEWPRIVSNVVPCEVDAVRVDMPSEAIFDDLTSEWTLMKFKPASRQPARPQAARGRLLGPKPDSRQHRP